MGKIFHILRSFKMPLIILCALLAAFLAAKALLPGLQSETGEGADLSGIYATCNTSYSNWSEISAEGFTVIATYTDGSEEEIDTSYVTIDTSDVKPVGSEVNVTLTYAGTEENPLVTAVSCEATANITREKVIGFQCGYPVLSDVTAVVYSNGELAFEGEGDVLVYNEGQAPWLHLTDYFEDEESIPTIYSVSFGEKVMPTDMNYWFEQTEDLSYWSLIYCEPIPSSVVTMIRTFYNCTQLTKTADWGNCTELLNITQAYAMCSGLTYVHDIPGSVTVARGTFEDASGNFNVPDLTSAVSLKNAQAMFKNCYGLIYGSMAPNAENISEMYYGCINLREMPTIPDSVTNMNSAFYGCVDMETVTNVPSGVTDLAMAFYGCEVMTGTLTIDASTDEFADMFLGACLATHLDLIGDSIYLDSYVLTCDSEGHITVNGEIVYEETPTESNEWDENTEENTEEYVIEG